MLLGIVCVFAFSVKAEVEEDATITSGVWFGSIDAAGMTAQEATEAIEAYVASLQSTSVTLVSGEKSITVTAEDLGLTWSNPQIVEEALGLGRTGNLIVRYKQQKDLEKEDKVYTIGFSVDTEIVTQLLEDKTSKLTVAAVDASMERVNGSFIYTEGTEGLTINLEESVALIEAYFATLWDEEEAELTLVTEVLSPRGSVEELSLVQDVLGSYSTSFSDSASGRIANITRAASLINGTVLYPGDEFSFYDLAAPFTAENGYELAGAYENGATIQSYGGGVCQVSTTLYNAVIRAELEVTMRYAHSMTVSYVEPSMDAAIAGTWKNLKFVNNTDSPIYIEAYTVGKTLYFKIYGQETRDSNRVVTFESETTSITEPDIQFVTTSDPIGTVTKVQSSHTGKTARLWKIVTVDGVEVSREVINNSTYSASAAIYNVGISSTNAEAVKAIKAAIATGDLATVKSVAAAYSSSSSSSGTSESTSQETTEGTQSTDGEDSETN